MNTFEAAPLRVDLAEGPEGSRAFWVHASDGIRLRVAHFPSDGTRGTILLFPGRTEYVEKYGRAAAEYAALGYHTLAIDWRGQGLADRMLEEPRTGHVGVFEDYQKDVAALVTVADALDVPGNRHLIAHSMGGCIGLRAVMDGLAVKSCVFSGPMWGIRIASSVRPAAWAITWSGKQMGLGHLFAPGTGTRSYVVSEPFEGNTLTKNRDMWDYMRRQVTEEPEMQLGGPSLNWLHEALGECRALMRRPSPDLPCICYVGSNERIVDRARIDDRMARWPDGRLDVVPDGEHEILMETRETRARVVSETVALFDASAHLAKAARA